MMDGALVHLALRLMVATPFLVSGVMKALDLTGATAEVRALSGLEPSWLFALLVVAVQLGGSALLLLGGRAGLVGALALAAFTLAATLLAHAFWTKPGAEQQRDLNIFMEHIAILGGLVATALLPRPDTRDAAAGDRRVVVNAGLGDRPGAM